MSPVRSIQNGPQRHEVYGPNSPIPIPLADVSLTVQETHDLLNQNIPLGLKEAILRRFISDSPSQAVLTELGPPSQQSPPPPSRMTYQAKPPRPPCSSPNETASPLAKERAQKLWFDMLHCQEQDPRAKQIIDNSWGKHVQVAQFAEYCGLNTNSNLAQRLQQGYYNDQLLPHQDYYGQDHSPHANGLTPVRAITSATPGGLSQQTPPPQGCTGNDRQQHFVSRQRARQQPQYSRPYGYYIQQHAKQPISLLSFRNTNSQTPQQVLPPSCSYTKQGVVQDARLPSARDCSPTPSLQGLTILPLNFPSIYVLPILLPRFILQILNDFLPEKHQYKLSLLDMDSYDAEMQDRCKRMYGCKYPTTTYELLFSSYMELPRVFAPCQVIGIMMKTSEGTFLGNVRRLKLEAGEKNMLCSKLMDAWSRGALNGGRRLDETNGNVAVKAEFEMFSGMAKKQLECFID